MRSFIGQLKHVPAPNRFSVSQAKHRPSLTIYSVTSSYLQSYHYQLCENMLWQQGGCLPRERERGTKKKPSKFVLSFSVIDMYLTPSVLLLIFFSFEEEIFFLIYFTLSPAFSFLLFG
ncbi:uncharacterized protein EV154DRAFT_255043 [Mucor mucedo]|uniref:uncharacterized protein n=1 Tax=Mucor mucedo TaxID=29922 RepID=UPI0022212428|nr:uncharacterized protein EV154DRAFT_255043 [Mucor mucedo]KAI7890243.1 hypothetical protein EV154DRAFT_255043 [Mucor mucedo]